MTERGVFAVDRGIWDHPRFQEHRPYSRREAFLWLVSEAAFKRRRVAVGAIIFELHRGSSLTLSGSWGGHGAGRKRACAVFWSV
jgi:hypothetical protein